MLDLLKADPEIYNLSISEYLRQLKTINLIASENYASLTSLNALSTNFSNKYAEGYPGKRFYGGVKIVDELEKITQKRALSLFDLDSKQWSVNVQPLSGSVANLSVYAALMKPNDSLLGMKLSDGGHLSHGHKTKKRWVSASSLFWKPLYYGVGANGLIDYNKINQIAKSEHPKVIVAGASAYPRNIDYSIFRKIANECGAYMIADIAHIAGFVATRKCNNPFDYADVVTTTTHKTLRGPRGALIFCRKELESVINRSVFPGFQGGPHMNQIAGIAVALREAKTYEFEEYQELVLSNNKAMCDELLKCNIKLVTGGSDNHLALIDLSDEGLTGRKVEEVLDAMNITVNRNTIPNKKSGIRVGSPAMTTRGMNNSDFRRIAHYLVNGIQIAKRISKETDNILDFRKAISIDEEINDIATSVTNFAEKFSLPGIYKVE